MTTSTSPQAPSSTFISNGASGASLPPWRLWLQTLNWRRDPGVEQRKMQYEQRRMQHELRMKQLKSEIEQIESETEQLRRENARLAELNAKLDVILFSSAINSSPPPSTPHKPET
jgi:cell shape-determining protein MreC